MFLIFLADPPFFARLLKSRKESARSPRHKVFLLGGHDLELTEYQRRILCQSQSPSRN